MHQCHKRPLPHFLSNLSCVCSSSPFSSGSKAGGIGSKAGGIGSAAAGQPGVEGESLLSKVLPLGGAAEQAGKLGEGEDRKHD